MKLVIEISKNQYTTLNAKTQDDIVDVIDHSALIKAIKNGTPLPKGHGRLIDADALIRVMDDRAEKLKCDRDLYDASVIVTAVDMFASTIIEADKDGEQE